MAVSASPAPGVLPELFFLPPLPAPAVLLNFFFFLHRRREAISLNFFFFLHRRRGAISLNFFFFLHRRRGTMSLNFFFDNGKAISDTAERAMHGFKRILGVRHILLQQIDGWRVVSAKARQLLFARISSMWTSRSASPRSTASRWLRRSPSHSGARPT